MSKLAIIVPLLGVISLPMWGNNDSIDVHQPHQLNAIEVLGIKQMPSAGSSPVTNINAAIVNRQGIVALKDVSAIVPNFFIPSYGSRMTSSIYMRGIGSRIDRPVVGLNIDGVPIMNKDAYDFDIPDLWSVQVARGAQSVLNGQNAMAGQINAYTLSPRDYQGLRLMVEYGRANLLRSSIGGYFRISPKLFSSLSIYGNRTDGFWKNEYNGKQVGAENGVGVRWKTVFLPSKWHSITNTMSFGYNDQSGYPYSRVETGSIAYNDTCFYRRNTFSDGLVVAWAGKRVVVTSLTSVQYLDDNMTLDQDFTPGDYFTLTQKRREWTFTEDLFTKGTRGKYSWLGGVFGFGKHTSMQAPVTFFDNGISSLIEDKRNEINPYYPISWDKRDFLLMSDFTTSTYGFALYHESRVDVGQWTFDAGLRWDIERIGCDYNSNADASYTTWQVMSDGTYVKYNSTPVNIHDNGSISRTYNELLPKLSITYNYGYGHVYTSITKGYKMGGINTQMFSDVLQQRVMESMGLSMPYKVEDIVTYRPETSWNYEVGVKASLFNDRLNAELVGFFIDCRDQQLTMFPPGLVTGRIMTNAGRTYSRGGELSLKYAYTDDLQFSLSYGYTHATFKKYNDGRSDYAGNRLPYVPTHTLFAAVQWRLPFTIGPIAPSINLATRGIGDIMWNEANTYSQPFYLLPSASIVLQSGNYSIKLWGENLTNTHYDTFYFMSMGNTFVQRGNPMTWGITLKLNLNKN